MTAREIVQALGGRWHGSYGMCRCPIHDDGREPGLKVADDPRKSDGIDLHCFGGCDWRGVKAVLRERGLLPEWSAVSAIRRGHDRGDRRRGDVARAKRSEAGVDADDEQRRIAHAHEMWRRAKPAAGTLVDVYLRSRGITIPIPPTIRYLADAKHGPSGLILPAMLAAVQHENRQVSGIHRTFLTASGNAKAPVTGNRMMLGHVAGGAVRLGPAGPKLAIAEGLETALSIAQACPGLSVWAALSTSGMRSLVLPPEVREVILCADADEPGEQAARAAAERFAAEGRRVSIARPSAGKDFNDVLGTVAPGATREVAA